MAARDDRDRETEVDDSDNDSRETELPTYSITSCGADYPVDGLVKRLAANDKHVPSFQRGYVWTKPQSDRFIESLL